MSKVVADMHVPPAFRRWGARLGLAVVVAIGIAYVPGQVLRRDSRTVKLRMQLDELDVEARTLTTMTTVLVRDVNALRTNVGAIENRARADLGMVYPGEIVLRVEPRAAAPTELVKPAPREPRLGATP